MSCLESQVHCPLLPAYGPLIDTGSVCGVQGRPQKSVPMGHPPPNAQGHTALTLRCQGSGSWRLRKRTKDPLNRDLLGPGMGQGLGNGNAVGSLPLKRQIFCSSELQNLREKFQIKKWCLKGIKHNTKVKAPVKAKEVGGEGILPVNSVLDWKDPLEMGRVQIKKTKSVCTTLETARYSHTLSSVLKESTDHQMNE